MTIALGVLCADGVVLGVDTQVSVDGGKLSGPKIQVFWESLPDYNIVSASCGHADSIETARVEIAEELEKFKGRSPVVRELRRSIEEALGRVYSRHIDPLPSLEERCEMDFTLLLAIRVGRTARLFRTNRAQVVEQQRRWCMGSGKEFADYVADLYLGDQPSVELAAQVSAYIIGVTKEHIEGVGHLTDVHILESNGRHWSLHLPDVRALEKNFASLFKRMRAVIACVDGGTVQEEHIIARSLQDLKNAIDDLRASQRTRLELRAKRIAGLKARKLDPQPTTAESSHPPPSPEKPGGSDES